jgi:hypothetical protein
MDHVRRIADQRTARRDVRLAAMLRSAKLARSLASVVAPSTPSAAAPGARLNSASLQSRSSGHLRLIHRPHDRAAAVEQGQERERPGAQKSLPGGVLCGPLGMHRRHDRQLAVLARAHRQSSALTHQRLRAVGTDHQPRRDLGPIAAFQVRGIGVHAKACQPARDQRAAGRAKAVDTGAQQRAVLGDEAEIRLADIGGVETQRGLAVGPGIDSCHTRMRS